MGGQPRPCPCLLLPAGPVPLQGAPPAGWPFLTLILSHHFRCLRHGPSQDLALSPVFVCVFLLSAFQVLTSGPVKLMSMSDRVTCAIFFLAFRLCVPSNSIAVFVFSAFLQNHKTTSSYSVSGTHVQRSQQGGGGPCVGSGVRGSRLL